MMRGLFIVGLALALLVPLRADDEKEKAKQEQPAPTLGIGDAAPKLELKEFVKGDAVKGFNKDTVYVLEFWATWCGPCVRAIPHVTELQKKNPKVVFIGVDVWENDLEKVKPFVEKMADKMEYRVAIDEGGETGKGKMAMNWLAAAGQNGIPCTMIVNGTGKVAWIGHPMEMEKPLEQIVAGKWDLQAAATEFKKKQELQAKLRRMSEQLQQAMAKGPDEAIKVVESIVDGDPEMEKQLAFFKFRMLEQTKKLDQQITYGERMVDKVLGDQPMALNQLAWTLIDPARKEAADPKLQRLALKAALKADTAKEGKDAAIADTLARAYFVTGDAAKALSTQERAAKLAKGTEMEEEIKQRLEEYRKGGAKP